MRLRDLREVQSQGDLRWFRPALDRLLTLRQEPDPRLTGFFTAEVPLYIARAPARLDVMGGIADYSGGSVLELPLDRSVSAILQRQQGTHCDLATRRDGRWHHCSVPLDSLRSGELGEPDALRARFASGDDRWPAYVLGVVQLCLGRLPASEAPPGFRILIDSAVPEGKGIASSAALEVATMAAFTAGCGIPASPMQMAADCQWVENHVVGAPCGIMDQMTSVCGRQDRLLRVRCQPGSIEGHLEIPGGCRFYGIDSGIRHAISGADYGTVRTAAFMGYRMIAELAGLRIHPAGARVRVDDPEWGGYLANLSAEAFSERFESRLPERMAGADFLEKYGGITDSVTRVRGDRWYPVRAATAHPIGEQRRVERFAERLARADGDPDAPPELGRLMLESHRSYGACGLGSEATDRLVDLVLQAGPAQGLFGAKITGGGSGGTVAVLGAADSESAVRAVAARYGAETGRTALVFAASGPGAAETGVLRTALSEVEPLAR